MILASFIALLLYAGILLWLYFGLERRQPQAPVQKEKITVIIAVRNRREELLRCLQALANQEYDRPYNVIIVDDHSTDGTFEITEQFLQHHSDWRIIHAESSSACASSKRAALHQAILQAEGEWLVFTDADCIPPVTWLSGLSGYFSAETVLVAGFSPQVSAGKSGWSNVLLIDSLSAALVSAATIGRQYGVTGVGRNLAYRRSAWNKISGFDALPDTLSGDDDFIIQELSRHGRVQYCLSPEAVVPAQGPSDLREFLWQKQRHLSSGQFYPLPAKIAYSAYHSTNLLLWPLFFFGLWNHWLFYPLLCKWVLDFYVLQDLAKRLQQKIRCLPFLIWQGIFVFYNIRAGWQRFRPPPTWQADGP